jgi:two-component system response regulator YesN
LLENSVDHFQLPDREKILAGFSNELVNKAFGELDQFLQAVYQVIEDLGRFIKNNRKSREKQYLYEIKNYIEQYYYREIKLKFFADRYFLSKEYLSKLFKEEFGYNIYEYLLRIRMEQARKLLADPEVKVVSVAGHLGYHDQYYFSKAFKTYYGITPTEFREKLTRDGKD